MKTSQINLRVIDVVDFVIKHRKDNAFKDWSIEDIGIAFAKAFTNKEAAVTFTLDGHITGVAIGKAAPDYKVFHVGNILCINKDAFKALCLIFRRTYPGYDLQGNRRAGLKRFKNTKRFLHLASKL